MAEEKTVPFQPIRGGQNTLTCAEYAGTLPGEKTVAMQIPKRIVIRIKTGQKVSFEPGIQLVPVSIADHFYLVGQGAIKYDFKAEADRKASEAKNLRAQAEELEKAAEALEPDAPVEEKKPEKPEKPAGNAKK